MNLEEIGIRELSVQDASFSYDPKTIATLRKACGKNGIIGQPRALSALSMGMSVNTKGYNIYISGEDGTGRHSAVRQIATSLAKPQTLYDLIYVHNFDRNEAPFLLLLPSPSGSLLQSGLNTIATFVNAKQWEDALAEEKKLEKTLSEVSNSLLRVFFVQLRTALGRHVEGYKRYLGNMIHDGSKGSERPLVEEYHPTHANLFGQLTKKEEFCHLNLSGGSILDAVGGFFVVRADKILTQNSLWDDLKLFAESSSFTLQGQQNDNSQDKLYIRPIASSLPVKIILVGSDALYDKLCDTDEEFLRLFKVSAEFDFSMPSNEENIRGTIAYILDVIEKNNLLPISDAAICELLKYSSWYAEMRDELTTKLSFIGDLLFEANYFAVQHKVNCIEEACIKEAMNARDFANGLTEEKINKEIEEGEMIISLEGSKVGVVNGLAVMDRGLASFGTPTVISVSVAPGSEGIVNIEHEAGLSGEIHDKGLLILEGYLRKRYARSFPLSIYAGICFEQSYAEVDGDSASSSELFALLSAIGELPVRQDIAVTGSVNQMGDIQPVGGINEKISGFFSICQKMGLTGRQGVVIPKQNVKSLILPDTIVQAIKEGRFHIYPISTIDEGMEILTLRPSGERNIKGNFPQNTLNRIIEDRLKKLYELSKPAN
jgi:lon-related putative ATP-dependent protease